MKELLMTSLVGRDSSGTPSNVPSNIGVEFSYTPNQPVYVPKYRTAPKTVNPGLGAGANPAGAGGS